ncbi:MAG: cupin domain-containing protein [Thiolinea sp.]
MVKPDQHSAEALDNETLEALASAQQSADLPEDVFMRMRHNVMQKIRQEKACEHPEFTTVRSDNKEGWIEALPGAFVKVLKGDISAPKSLLSYLVRLEPGFSMEGHSHPFDEETLMLEGDLTLGNLKLSAGDFHFAAAGASHGNVHTSSGCLAYMRGALPV